MEAREKKRMWNRIKRWVQKLFRKKDTKQTAEERLLRAWTAALTERAEVFNGLYSGLVRVREGTAKKRAHILGEWWTRTRYQWEEQELERLGRKYLEPLASEGSDEDYIKCAGLLLQAAEAAGVTQEQAGELVLDETNTNAYVEWEGQELYLGDRVEVMTPAWYQKGRVIEQGHCRKLEEESE